MFTVSLALSNSRIKNYKFRKCCTYLIYILNTWLLSFYSITFISHKVPFEIKECRVHFVRASHRKIERDSRDKLLLDLFIFTIIYNRVVLFNYYLVGFLTLKFSNGIIKVCKQAAYTEREPKKLNMEGEFFYFQKGRWTY